MMFVILHDLGKLPYVNLSMYLKITVETCFGTDPISQ